MTINGLTGQSLLSGLSQGGNQLSQEDFLQLLVVELSGQNPLEPLNDKELFQQIATLTNVQGINELRLTMRLERAQSLLGHQVDFLGADGNLYQGVVERLTFEGSRVFLLVDGAVITLEDVYQDYGPPADTT